MAKDEEISNKEKFLQKSLDVPLLFKKEFEGEVLEITGVDLCHFFERGKE